LYPSGKNKTNYASEALCIQNNKYSISEVQLAFYVEPRFWDKRQTSNQPDIHFVQVI